MTTLPRTDTVHHITLPTSLRGDAVRRVFTSITRKGHSALFVGGCVRDSLLCRPIFDIDIATTATPQQTMQCLQDMRILAIPSGISHGTITARVDNTNFEITTLRQDTETFGRHARVTFTTDWREDAQRRDFTMNALYADQNGTVYDFFNGIDDAKRKRVRFIGEPQQRIQEDYLRILRFFRFLASHGSLPADKEALSACRQMAEHLIDISAERLWKEIALLLKTARPVPILALMARYRILENLPELSLRLQRVGFLCRLDRRYGGNRALRRFVTLLRPPVHADIVAEKWRFSGKQRKKLEVLSKATTLAKMPWREVVYRYGHSMLRDILLLSRPVGLSFLHGLRVGVILRRARSFKPCAFPLRGEDFVALGYVRGPSLGAALKRAERWWLDNDLAPNAEQCRAYIKDNMSAQKDTKP